MFRRMFAGLIAVAALAAGGWALLRQRGTGRPGADDAVQWPFDKHELRALMSRVVNEQRELISTMENAAGRVRAQSFLEYYERRRQAAS